MKIKLKRAYEKSSEQDGIRILVDRLWPRGITKQKANIDLWAKDIAPSVELRKWFHHEPEKWPEFRKRYLQELKNKEEEIHRLKRELNTGMVTLVYGAKDQVHNGAVILKEVLES